MSFGTVNAPIIYTNQIDETNQLSTSGGTTTLSNASSRRIYFTGSSAQTVVLPNVTTLAIGMNYEIINNSTGTITINIFGGTLYTQIGPSGFIELICVNISTNNTAAWTNKTYAVFDNTASLPYPTAPQTEGVWYGTGTRGNCQATSITLGNGALGNASNSVTIGNGAKVGSTSSSDIISIGSGAGSSTTLTTNTRNYFIGSSAGSSNYAGINNIGIGASSMLNNYTGNQNIVIGHLSGQNMNTTIYNVGTASQSGTTITGAGGADWEGFNRGSVATIVFSTGEQATINTKNTNTSLTSTVSQTVASTTYNIYYGTQYSTGTAAASGTTATGTGTTWTSAMAGGYIIFLSTPTVVAKIIAFVSTTSLTLATTTTVSPAVSYRIYYSTPAGNIIIGYNQGNAITDHSNTILIGKDNLMYSQGSSNSSGLAIGDSNGTGTGGVAIGYQNSACVPTHPTTLGITAGVAIGTNCIGYGYGQGVGGVAIGVNCTAITSGNVQTSVAIGYNAIYNAGAPASSGGLVLGHNVQMGLNSVGVGVNVIGGASCAIVRMNHTGTCGANTVGFGRTFNSTGTGCVMIGDTMESAGANNIFIGNTISDTINTISNTNITTNVVFGRNNLRNIPSSNTINSNVICGHSCFDTYTLTANTQFAPTNNIVMGVTIPAVMLTGARNTLIGNRVYAHGTISDSILLGTDTTAGGLNSIRIGLSSGAGTSFSGSISGTTLTLSSSATGNPFNLGLTVHLPGMNTEVTINTLLSGSLGISGSTYTVSASVTMSDRALRAYGVTQNDIGIGYRTLASLVSGTGRNIAIGYDSGSATTTGERNITIGENAQVGAATTRAVVIGDNITNTTNNSVAIGANSTILARFEVPGAGTEAAGAVTINATTGTITLSAVLNAAAALTITCTNSRVQATSIVQLNALCTPNTSYCVTSLRSVSAGSFQFTIINISAVNTNAAPIVNFSINYPQ